MRIICPIKQVPEVEYLSFNPETRTLNREGVPLEINPFDRRAFTCALEIRAACGGSVTALTMGPPAARHALAQALALGLDRAVHLLDRTFAGSDTWATANALAGAARRLGFDLIFCGKYSVDAETGQVGPELAELLGIPHVTAVTALEVLRNGAAVRVERETDYGLEVVEVALPALLTASERLIKPLKPPPDPVAAAAEAQAVAEDRLLTWTAADLGVPAGRLGTPGSLTEVAALEEMARPRTPTMIPGADPAAAAAGLLAALRARDIGPAADDGAEDGPRDLPPAVTPDADPAADVWVVAERLPDGNLRPVTRELLGAARRVARTTGGRAVALLLGHEVRGLTADLHDAGAQVVLVADDPALARYAAGPWTAVLAGAVTRAAAPPFALLIPATARGRDYGPRLAARLACGLTGDCTGLDLADDGRLRLLKPALGGNVVAPILTRTRPQMGTVRPGMVHPWHGAAAASPAVDALPVNLSAHDRWPVLGPETDAAGLGGVALDEAEIVVCAGAGIGRAEEMPLVEALAAALGRAFALPAAVGVTRKVVDLGWAPRQLQIGLTGQAVAPQLYLGLGVRGAWNHLVGIRRAGTIVGVNTDAAAPIFEQADLGVVADWRAIAKALLAALESPA